MLERYIEYFKGKQEAQTELNSFYLGDMDDVFNNKMKISPDAPLMFLEVYSLIKSEWSRDHRSKNYLGAFVIYDRVADHKISEMRMAESLSFSERIAEAIIAAIENDRESYHPFAMNFKGGFEMNKTRMMFDGLVGWRIEFEFIGS